MTTHFLSPTFSGLSPIVDITTPISTHSSGSLTINHYNDPQTPIALNFGDPLLGTPATITITPLQSAHQLTIAQRIDDYEEAIQIAQEDNLVRALNSINAAENSPIRNISRDMEEEISPLHLSDFNDELMDLGSTTDESSDDGSLKRSRDSEDGESNSDEESSNKKPRSDDSTEDDSSFADLTWEQIEDIVNFADSIGVTTPPVAQSFTSPGSSYYSYSPINLRDAMELSGENGSPFPYLTDDES